MKLPGLLGTALITAALSCCLPSGVRDSSAGEPGREQWRLLPLRTPEQEALGLPGGEGFQQSQAMVFSPSNPRVVYMATDTSQVWKSTDGGASWTHAGSGFPANGAASLFVHPLDENILLAAGFLGESFERGSTFPRRLQGIFRSEDGGRSWTVVERTDFFRRESKGRLFGFTRSRGRELLFCGTWADGLLLSADAGRTWGKTAFQEERIRDVTASPGDPDHLLIASESGLYDYAVSGTCARIGKGLPGAPLSISSSGKPGNLVYAACGGAEIYVSRDAGRTFASCRPSMVPGCSFGQIEASPAAGGTAFALPVRSPLCSGIWSTGDGGASWRKAAATVNDNALPLKKLGEWRPGPIAFHPTEPGVALVGVNGYDTIVRTDDAGATWRYSASGFCGGRMARMAFPGKDHLLVALTDFGVWESRDAGNSFVQLNTGRLSGEMSSSAVAVGGNVYVASLGTWRQKGLVISRDRGKVWEIVRGVAAGRLPVVAVAGTDGACLYAGSSRSLDGGTRWEQLDHEILAVSPGDHRRVYALEEEQGRVVVLTSADSGTTWTRGATPGPLARRQITDVAILPGNPEAVLLASTQGIATYCRDRWAMKGPESGLTPDAFGLCHVSRLAVSPVSPFAIYAGRRAPGLGPSNGVFRSLDGGQTWEDANRNLPQALDVFGLAIAPDTGAVYLGTSLGTYCLKPGAAGGAR